jgi:phospholipid transport system substrate-binding protein
MGGRTVKQLITRCRRIAKMRGVCFAILLATGTPCAAAGAPPTNPQNTVRSLYDTLLDTMKNARALGQSGRYARLAPVIQKLFDIPAMARLAVGPSWATLSPAQQQQVTEAFGHYISATYADRFDSYSGQQLRVTGEQPYGSEVIVQTRIVKADGDWVTLNYRMHENSSSWQISDVYLDGTISQLATQRSEFHSILQREGVDGLISALNRKVDLLTRTVAKT